MGYKVYKKQRSFYDGSHDVYYEVIVGFVGVKGIRRIKTFEVVTYFKDGTHDYMQIKCPRKTCHLKWKIYGRNIMIDWHSMQEDV
jgi:hypothetical protein